MRQNAAQLVTELGGLPLGIDQAGAYLAETACGLTHYLRLFRQCRARLLARRGTLPLTAMLLLRVILQETKKPL